MAEWRRVRLVKMLACKQRCHVGLARVCVCDDGLAGLIGGKEDIHRSIVLASPLRLIEAREAGGMHLHLEIPRGGY